MYILWHRSTLSFLLAIIFLMTWNPHLLCCGHDISYYTWICSVLCWHPWYVFVYPNMDMSSLGFLYLWGLNDVWLHILGWFLTFNSFLALPHLHVFFKESQKAFSLLAFHVMGHLLHLYFPPYRFRETSSTVEDLWHLIFPSLFNLKEGWNHGITPCTTSIEWYYPPLPNWKGEIVL